MDENTICEDLGCKCDCGCERHYERNTHMCHQDLLLSLDLINEDDSLQVSDSPWTGSGSIKIDHKNLIDGTDELNWYKVAIDKNGHIKEIGEILGIVSAEADGLLPMYSEENITEDPIEADDLLYDVTKGKYVKLPAEAFVNTEYEDGETGWTLKATQDGNGNNIVDTYANKEDYQTKITTTNKLSANLIDDSSSSKKFVSTSEKESWSNKANKNEIPTKVSDLTNDENFMTENSFDNKLMEYQGFDPAKTQYLKNVNGVFTWVSE